MGWFGRKKNKLPIFRFKSGEDFIDYHCSYMNTRLQPGSPLAAVVLDAREKFGTSVAVKIEDSGLQTALLRVASTDGGFTVMAQTASDNGDKLQPGDSVAWIPSMHLPEIAKSAGDDRFGWMGFIVAKIAPEIDENSKEMKVLSRY